MTLEEFEKEFTDNSDEYRKFSRVEHKLSQKPDLHGFILLDKLQPQKGRIVAYAVHDEIFLDVSPGRLAEAINKDQVIELIRCGVRYDAPLGCLAMFV